MKAIFEWLWQQALEWVGGTAAVAVPDVHLREPQPPL